MNWQHSLYAPLVPTHPTIYLLIRSCYSSAQATILSSSEPNVPSNCYHLVHRSCRMHLLCCCAQHDYRQPWIGYEVSVIICSCLALMPVFCSKCRSSFYNFNLLVIWLAEFFVKSSCQDHNHLQRKSLLRACHEPMKLGKVPCKKSHLHGCKDETRLEHPEKACPL